MGTPAKTATEHSGVSRLLSRAKTVLRRKDGSKRFSLSGRSPAPVSSTTTPAAVGPSSPIPSDSTPAVAPLPVEETPAPVAINDEPQPVRILRSQIDAERYNRLGQRFKLPAIGPSEFSSTSEDKEALRIEKPIRVRIHRSCHKCQTAFGGNRVCATCQHPRCSKCTRVPTKKSKEGQERLAPKTPPADWIEPDTHHGKQQKYVLTLPNKRPGGQPLVRKPPTQRVRRNCCGCSSLYQSGVKICLKCEHVRCQDCPRDPPKRRKYPDGYPGDAYSATSTAPLKYKCHQCFNIFPAIAHPGSPEGKATALDPPPSCVPCGHTKCSECPRAPIVKVIPAPDAEVLKSVEAKLARLNVGEPVEAA